MSGKQHKRELKRQRELQRQQQREAERRRTWITVGVIAAVVSLGLGLVWFTISQERAVELAAACGAQRPPAAEASRPQNFTEAPGQPLRDGDYTAVIETSCGTVEVDLYEDRAPQTVSNFVALASVGFYDGLQVFRNAPSIFALQTGAATNEASFQIGYTFEDELAAAEEEGYSAGSLAMANSGANTNGSQFFFTYGDSELPPSYTKFGQVTEGLGALEQMGAVPVEGESPTEPIFIESVQILIDGQTLTEVMESEGAAEGDAGADGQSESDSADDGGDS